MFHMEKKKLVVNYKNCPEEVLEAIKKKYPNGYSDYVMKVQKPSGDFFYAITVDTADASYLIKVDVKIDNLTEEEFEKEFGEDNSGVSDDSTFGREEDNLDNIEASESSSEE
jgi:hypothetical protein